MAWRSGEPGLGVCGIWAESPVVAPRMTKAKQTSGGRMDGLGFMLVCQVVAPRFLPGNGSDGHCLAGGRIRDSAVEENRRLGDRRELGGRKRGDREYGPCDQWS